MGMIKEQFNSDKYFSVGMTFILLCVSSGIKPACFGFDTEEITGDRTHYFEKRPPAGPCHSVNAEKKILTDLFLGGKIYLF